MVGREWLRSCKGEAMTEGTEMSGDIVSAFDRDAKLNGGYGYTTNVRLSSQLAVDRWHEALLCLFDIHGLRVLDVGCGDGVNTVLFYDKGRPASIHGVDPAESAIEVARGRTGDRAITWSVNDGYELRFAADSFDVAYLIGVLHHVARPFDVIREALRLAPRLVVLEPNGWNPVLKLLEKFSRYHIEHGEKSYTSRRLRRWVEAAGGSIVSDQLAGLVPMFCPAWLARTAKCMEPLIERIPVLNALGCAIYVFVAERRGAAVRAAA
jgi:ubiquinone/menaquinone biosynthesis C-methylase UbiE